MKLKGWTLPKRKTGNAPHVKISISVTQNPNERWATDFGNTFCDNDGCYIFAPVIDCGTCEVLSYALKLTGKAKIVEPVLEEALLSRFGTLHPS